MNAAMLIPQLEAQGVRLAPRGDRLHVDAPRGALTTEVMRRLRSCKTEILAVVKIRHALAGRRLQAVDLLAETGLDRDALYPGLGLLYEWREVRTSPDGYYWLAEAVVN